MQITQEQIRAKAVQMFNVFSAAMNKQQDTYSVNFDNLQPRYQVSWLELAEHELKNAKQNPT